MNEEDGNDVAASLAFATHLSDGMALAQAPESQEMAQEEAQEPEVEEDTLTPRIDDLEGQFKDFQKETKTLIKDQMDELKDMIKSSLEDAE